MVKPPVSSLQAIVSTLWCDVLGPDANPGSDFISNGGDSFKAAVFTVRLLEQTGRELDYVEVLRASSLHALADSVDHRPPAADDHP
jgi:hypothetical protein